MPDDLQISLGSGIAAFEAKQFSQARSLLKPYAEAGEATAQYRLAIMCQNGLGQVRNEQLAYRWMASAAGQYYGPAVHGLGQMHLEGDCTVKDERKALACFQQAADLGLEGSMVALARMYQQGRGTDKDAIKAKVLYERAGFDPDELPGY